MFRLSYRARTVSQIACEFERDTSKDNRSFATLPLSSTVCVLLNAQYAYMYVTAPMLNVLISCVLLNVHNSLHVCCSMLNMLIAHMLPIAQYAHCTYAAQCSICSLHVCCSMLNMLIACVLLNAQYVHCMCAARRSTYSVYIRMCTTPKKTTRCPIALH